MLHSIRKQNERDKIKIILENENGDLIDLPSGTYLDESQEGTTYIDDEMWLSNITRWFPFDMRDILFTHA